MNELLPHNRIAPFLEAEDVSDSAMHEHSHVWGRLALHVCEAWPQGALKASASQLKDQPPTGLTEAVEKGFRAALDRMRMERRVVHLEMMVKSLVAKVSQLESAPNQQPFLVAIDTLAPEPYRLVNAISILVRPDAQSYIASFVDANISMTGDTIHEAVQGVKAVIIGTFKRLSGKADSQLGPGPRKQKAILTTLIQPLG
jgi:hypothetical protein